MARPPTYHTDAEKPVTVSVRIPRALYAQAQQYVSMRRTTLTEVLLDGLRLRLETPADPRDVLVSQDNTVMQELQEMIRAAVHKEIGTLSDFLGPQARAAGLLPTPAAAPVPELSHDDNITALQESIPAAAAPPRGGIQHYENTTVIQELAKPAYLVDECLPFDEDLAPALGALAGPPPAILPDATPGGQDTVPPAPATIEAQIDQHITRLEDRIHEMHALNGESEATVREISQDDNNTVLQERDVAVQGGGTDTPPPAPPRPRSRGRQTSAPAPAAPAAVSDMHSEDTPLASPSDPAARRARILAAVPLEGERGMTIRALAEQLGMQYMLVNNDMRTLRQRKHVRQVPGAQGGGYVRLR